MNLLPPPGPQRTRQLTLLIIVGLVATFFVWRWAPWRTAGALAPASNPQNAQTTARGAGATKQASAAIAAMPEPVKLDKLEPVPDEPGAGRNLFRFGVPKPVVAPPPPVVAPPPPVVQGPPPPRPGPPPIDLQLKGMVKQRADGPTMVVLKDPKTDAQLSGFEGQILDGKYKILKVGESSVIVSYVDGTGQRTIQQERKSG